LTVTANAPLLRPPGPARRLLTGDRLGESVVGIVLTALSLIVMPLLPRLSAVRCVILATAVIHYSRAPTLLRAVCLVVSLSVATAGSGLPMCVSLLAQAAVPCDMHSGHNGAATHEHAAHLAALVAQGPGQACHQDAAGLGCAAGSTCPTGSPATGVWAKVSVSVRIASRTRVLGPSTTLISYLAPPLAPPPQA
jgi:hypothetical protein